MNKIGLYFTKLILSLLLKQLSKFTEEELKAIANKVNLKVDIPKMSEETEGKIIFSLLSNSVELAKSLLNIVRL